MKTIKKHFVTHKCSILTEVKQTLSKPKPNKSKTNSYLTFKTSSNSSCIMTKPKQTNRCNNKKIRKAIVWVTTWTLNKKFCRINKSSKCIGKRMTRLQIKKNLSKWSIGSMTIRLKWWSHKVTIKEKWKSIIFPSKISIFKEKNSHWVSYLKSHKDSLWKGPNLKKSWPTYNSQQPITN